MFKKGREYLCFNASRSRMRILRLFHTSFNPAQNITPNHFLCTSTKTRNRIRELIPLATNQSKDQPNLAFQLDKLFQPAHHNHTNTSPHTRQDSKEEGGSTIFRFISNTVLQWSNHSLKKNKTKQNKNQKIPHRFCQQSVWCRLLQWMVGHKPAPIQKPPRATLPRILPSLICFMSPSNKG